MAAKGGTVRTLRAPGRFGSIRPGNRVTYSAKRLSDGTFRAGSIHSTGHAGHAVLRGVVVRNQRRLHRLLISAGNSVFSVRAPTRGFASSRGPRPGDRVEVRVKLTKNGLDAGSVSTLGHDATMELQGIFLDVTGSTLRLAVEHRGEVFAAVPADLQLPQLQAGDEVELIVTVDAAGAFTLVSIQTDDENDNDHEGIGEDHGRVEVSGAIAQLTTDSITVQSHGGSPVTCAVPAGTDLSGFQVNDRVEMRCADVNGTLTLSRLKQDDEGDDDGGGGGDDD